jgi:D-alanyl-D-alanine carboxypeptidase
MKMIRDYLTVIAFLILTTCLTAQSVTEARFQSLIDSIYAAHPAAVGILVHVEGPDRDLSWSGASGYADKEAVNDLGADQPALIASSIKTYVSAAMLRLVEEGKLSIDDPVGKLLTNKTRKLFEKGGYDLESIKIKHLLSHTSGIQNYADGNYIDFIGENPGYRWTRDEQLELTLEIGGPLGKPGDTYSYTDANYLLLTEIMEGVTGKPFYTAMRELLRYQELGLSRTWFPTLEDAPAGTAPLAHQYWSENNWDSYDIDVSVDLYGGGGIACPMEDLASFSWNLFNTNIIQDTTVLNLIYTEIPTLDSVPSQYYLGLAPDLYRGLTGYGHGGFWGTAVLWFPKLNASVAVCILERDMRRLRPEIMDLVVGILAEDTTHR